MIKIDQKTCYQIPPDRSSNQIDKISKLSEGFRINFKLFNQQTS